MHANDCRYMHSQLYNNITEIDGIGVRGLMMALMLTLMFVYIQKNRTTTE